MSARTAGRTAGGKRQCEYEGSHAPALCDQPEFVAALERGRRQRSGGTGPPWALRKFFVTTTLLVSLVMSAEAFSSVPAISRCRWPAAPSSVLPSSDGTNEYMGRHCPAVWRGRWQIGVRNSRTTHAADSHGRRASLLVHFGIPKMFRWLTDQYPNINRRLSEGLKDGTVVDNFYLDMNGIIHPCTHGNSGDIVVLDETEMFKKIFCYVDRSVFALLYFSSESRVGVCAPLYLAF